MSDPAVDAAPPPTGAAAPRGLDLDRLEAYLAAHRPELAGPLSARLITGGKNVLGDSELAEGNPVADGIGPRAGFPSGAELIDRYAGRSDVDVGPLHWHLALGCFKLAVICEGIHYRHTLGQTLGEGFDRIGAMVAPLVEHGLRAVREK